MSILTEVCHEFVWMTLLKASAGETKRILRYINGNPIEIDKSEGADMNYDIERYCAFK